MCNGQAAREVRRDNSTIEGTHALVVASTRDSSYADFRPKWFP